MKKYKYIQLGIASPEEIRSWSYGEVKKHETINYRTLKPERDGLFCEVIFGPTRDYQCACGKSKRTSERQARCDRCGVELTDSKVRRERMGHIELAAPVVHTWFFRNTPSKIALLLDMKSKVVEDIVYLASYIVVDPGNIEELYKGRILTEQENSYYQRLYGPRRFKSLTGAEAIKYLLQELDLKETYNELRGELMNASKLKREKIVKRLEVVESFIKSGNKPEWMVMEVIPVLPPDLRPMVQLDGGRFATTDLNDLYRRILNRNSRLKKQFEQRAPNLITKNEKRMLQEAVDALIDNGRRNRKPVMERNRPLKSLSDLLRGKQGRFRQNLLGKRVDYSGRSVIVVGPDLQMYQCGIPREMALILFKPFIINAIINREPDGNESPTSKISIKRAKEMIEEGHPIAMTELEKIVVEHPVLLNRAPTLHRLGIQAFEPKLVEGKAIRLHPLVCPAFNADFDGDQMAVHVPLSTEAQAEARVLMLASKNILAPKDGKPIVTPSQDMVLGNYYLTIERSGLPNEGRIFKDMFEVELAYEKEEITLHTKIFVPIRTLKRYRFNKEDYHKYILTTYGKLIFNTIFPDGFVYLNEPTHENLIKETPSKYFLDIRAELEKLGPDGDSKQVVRNFLDKFVEIKNNQKVPEGKYAEPNPFNKKFLGLIISEIFKQYGLAETSKALDKMKDLGFKYSTLAGITVSAFDIVVQKFNPAYSTSEEKQEATEMLIKFINKFISPHDPLYKELIVYLNNSKDQTFKERLLKVCDKIVLKYDEEFAIYGTITQDEKRKHIIALWTKAKEVIEEVIKMDVKNNFKDNHIYMMSDSGARGNIANFVQLAGMRGLMAKPSGEIMEIPIKKSFREGLTMSEFFISTHGARKGSTDTALKTAESGYLTRRLVDVAQDVIVSEEDCGTDRGILVSDIYELDEETSSIVVPFRDRIVGRFAAKPIMHPETKKVIVNANEFIDENKADQIIEAGIKQAYVRTLLTCNSHSGVCVKCYGSDLSTGKQVEIREAVGIIAAQSIGEPGTQLTMRTFHLGGVAGDDITQGLPRIQELFEAREPKGKAIISEIRGKVVAINEERDNRMQIVIRNAVEEKTYLTDSGKLPIVKVGDEVEPGQRLVEGLIHPKELLRVTTVEDVQNYILAEVQKVYRSQGVEISDKHIEIIIRQMLQKITIVNEGQTDILPGTIMSKSEFHDVVNQCIKNGKQPPIAKPLLLGITRASLRSDSFLSAASFQETTRVLTEAAIRGKIDYLEGLKENVIIGGLIPAGTGLVENVEYEFAEEVEE